MSTGRATAQRRLTRHSRGDRDGDQKDKPDAIAEARHQLHGQVQRLVLQQTHPGAGAVVEREELLLRGEDGQREVADEGDERSREQPPRLATSHDPADR